MSKTFSLEAQSSEPGGIRLGVVRGISYGLFGPPGEFVPQARALGAGLIRAYLYWSQIEPEPGHYRWDTVALMAEKMAGARSVARVTTGDQPGLRAFEVDRPGRGPLLVIWDHRDPFDGEDEPPAEVTWPWPEATASLTDVFGRTRTARCQYGQIHLPVSVTPLFIEE